MSTGNFEESMNELPHIFSSLPFILSGQVAGFLGCTRIQEKAKINVDCSTLSSHSVKILLLFQILCVGFTGRY